MRFLLLLFLLSVLLADGTVLYLLDCGSHGDKMLSIIQNEGYNGTLHYVCVNLNGCERSDCPEPESVYFQILANLSSDEDTRLSLSYGENNQNDFSVGLFDLSQRGVRIYAAAGNDAQASGCYFPASQTRVIAVTAADSDGALQYNSDGCSHKPPELRLAVSACFTSDATAIASARGLLSNFTRETICPLKYQWYYMFTMLALLLIFIVVASSHCSPKFR